MLFPLLLTLLPQNPPASSPPREERTMEFDERTGWPKSSPVSPKPDLEVVPSAADTGRVATPAAASARVEAAPSSLDAVFAAIGSPRAFRSLGGLSIWWRITVHGPQGETIGLREVTHLCDPSVPDRDRLEFPDGRVCGRLGPTVFAERRGVPWQTWVEASSAELLLFGMQVRMPWAFADAQRFAEAGADAAAHGGEPGTRIRLQERVVTETLGPEPEPGRSIDRFELWWPRDKAVPAELVHSFAAHGQTRRVRLEDWRSVGSVMMPFRRIYVDASGRPTTTLEILRVKAGQPLSERDFRLQ